MTITTFNINSYVRVKLTDAGRKIHREQHDALMAGLRAEHCWEYRPVVEDEHGWSRWQLWQLMHDFGESVFNGCRMPFETTIELETKAT